LLVRQGGLLNSFCTIGFKGKEHEQVQDLFNANIYTQNYMGKEETYCYIKLDLKCHKEKEGVRSNLIVKIPQ